MNKDDKEQLRKREIEGTNWSDWYRYITPTRSLECLAESAWAMTWISCQIEIHDPHHCRKVPVD